MIASKGRCKACDRPIQHSTHDKCMYCSAELDEEQKLTDQEKAALEAKRQLREDEWQAVQKRRIAALKKGDSGSDSSGSSWLDSGDGVDCSGE